jgi:hypothetical protein
MTVVRKMALLLALMWWEKGKEGGVWTFGSAELLGFKPTRVIVEEIKSNRDDGVDITMPT